MGPGPIHDLMDGGDGGSPGWSHEEPHQPIMTWVGWAERGEDREGPMMKKPWVDRRSGRGGRRERSKRAALGPFKVS